jgi:hypothetical protein
MKKMKPLAASLALFVSATVSSEACSVCMGGGGLTAEAANGAIFVMLGVLAGVLGLIVLAGYSLVKRGQMPVPPHAELVRSLSESN